ncbi:hypothetical protein FRC10_009176 [Ceratobasidium sp. 414]|nr:hypothetical protein FRC10_009176 [Ceratobasidium sp. 414]
MSSDVAHILGTRALGLEIMRDRINSDPTPHSTPRCSLSMSHHTNTTGATDAEKAGGAHDMSEYANGGYTGGRPLHPSISTDTQVCLLDGTRVATGV